MLFLATFFLMSDMEEEEGEHQFDFLNDFLRATVDMADLVGIYLVMSRVSGKGSVKVLVAGLGWGFAELVLTRLVFLWVGARGVEFDWKYIQKSFDANISLLHFISLAGLVWMWTKRNTTHGPGVTGVLSVVLGLACYKGLIVSGAAALLELGKAGPGRPPHLLPGPGQSPALPGGHQYREILSSSSCLSTLSSSVI